jgi:hypothetical protein
MTTTTTTISAKSAMAGQHLSDESASSSHEKPPLQK